MSSQTPLRPLGIVEGPAPSPIMHRKVTTAENAKGPQTRPCEVLGGSRCRSMCVVESTGDGMTESTILKPRTGAGVTKKKTVVRSLRSGGVGGVKAKGGMGGVLFPPLLPTRVWHRPPPRPLLRHFTASDAGACVLSSRLRKLQARKGNPLQPVWIRGRRLSGADFGARLL